MKKAFKTVLIVLVVLLVIGAAMVLTETQSPEEQQTIQDEQDFNEFLAQMEAEEEEQTFQLSM